MNRLFYYCFLIAFVWGAVQVFTGNPMAMADMTDALIAASRSAVNLAIGLVGVMAFFLGLMKVVEAAGLLNLIARGMHPILCRLFPSIPADHPALGAMVMNLSANVLGLGNAATPFGIKAMEALESLNKRPGTASDAMILFLAINTTSITLLPTGVIALRASAGSVDPAAILPTTLFATVCSTTVGILIAKLMARYYSDESTDVAANTAGGSYWGLLIGFAVIAALVFSFVQWSEQVSPWLIPVIVMSFLSYGYWKSVPVYEAFCEGAKEGFQTAIRIIPYMVGILAAIAFFQASGALNAFISWVSPITSLVGLPGEALPMALLRPMSGSGAYGVLAATLDNPGIGPDSYVGMLVSTIQGSTETTFYVLAVYFGAVRIRQYRYALVPALCGDAAGIFGAVLAVNLFL